MAEQRLVRDAMAPPTETIHAGQALGAARQRMLGETRVKSLIVIEGDRPVGMLRYNDATREGAGGATIAEAMLTDVPVIRADQALEDLTGVMSEYDVDRLAVVDESGTLVGELQRTALTLSEEATGEAATIRERLSDAIANEATPVHDVKKDMAVVGVQGSKIGKVKEVMADSLTGSLTHVVVHTGLLFGKDKSIPADLVDHVEGDQVHLKVDKSDVNMLPDLSMEA